MRPALSGKPKRVKPHLIPEPIRCIYPFVRSLQQRIAQHGILRTTLERLLEHLNRTIIVTPRKEWAGEVVLIGVELLGEFVLLPAFFQSSIASRQSPSLLWAKALLGLSVMTLRYSSSAPDQSQPSHFVSARSVRASEEAGSRATALSSARLMRAKSSLDGQRRS